MNESSARRSSNEPPEAIPGEAISRRMGRGGLGSYRAGLFEHRYVALRVALAEVRRVCNLVKHQCVVEIARPG